MKLSTTRKDVGQVVELLSEGITSITINTDAGPIHIKIENPVKDGIFKMINGEDDWLRQFPAPGKFSFFTDDPEAYVEASKKVPGCKAVFMGFEEGPLGMGHSRIGVYPLPDKKRVDSGDILAALSGEREISIIELVDSALQGINRENNLKDKLHTIVNGLTPEEQHDLISLLRPDRAK